MSEACLFPRKDLLKKVYFPEETSEEEGPYYIAEHDILVDREERVYIKKDAYLRKVIPQSWSKYHLLGVTSKHFHLSLLVPSNWRMERVYEVDKEKTFPVTSLMITQTEEIEEDAY